MDPQRICFWGDASQLVNRLACGAAVFKPRAAVSAAHV
jgi:hypothetical protein